MIRPQQKAGDLKAIVLIMNNEPDIKLAWFMVRFLLMHLHLSLNRSVPLSLCLFPRGQRALPDDVFPEHHLPS